MYKLYSLTISPLQKLIKENLPFPLFLLSYFACTILGWAILQLPFCQKSLISSLDTFFTAASAVSTTGLATVDVEKTFSLFGQLVLLLLIQLGGITYMIFSSFIIRSFKKNGRVEFPHLVKEVVSFTLICESIGMLLLYFCFRNEGMENALLNAVFHTISAFCTAGFSLFSSNLEGYQNHFAVNAILCSLSLLGALGFFLGIDFIRGITSSKKWAQLCKSLLRPFVTTVILFSTFLFFLITPLTTNLVTSFFQVVYTVTTAGFNLIDMGALSHSTLIFLTFLMLFGVSLIGSGTNMRGTSFFALLKLTSTLNSFRRKKVFLKRLQLVFSTFAYYILCLLVFSLLLSFIENKASIPLFFETASALCTVGLSVGITSELSAFGKCLIIFLMLTGRIGILIFGYAASTRKIEAQEKKRIPIPS